MTKRLQTMYRS